MLLSVVLSAGVLSAVLVRDWSTKDSGTDRTQLGRRSLGSDKFWSFEEFKDFERKSQVTDTRAAEQLA